MLQNNRNKRKSCLFKDISVSDSWPLSVFWNAPLLSAADLRFISGIANKKHPVCIYSLSHSVRYLDYLEKRRDSICALTSGSTPLPALSPPLLLHHFILTVNTESCLFPLPSVHRQNILTSVLPSQLPSAFVYWDSVHKALMWTRTVLIQWRTNYWILGSSDCRSTAHSCVVKRHHLGKGSNYMTVNNLLMLFYF